MCGRPLTLIRLAAIVGLLIVGLRLVREIGHPLLSRQTQRVRVLQIVAPLRSVEDVRHGHACRRGGILAVQLRPAPVVAHPYPPFSPGRFLLTRALPRQRIWMVADSLPDPGEAGRSRATAHRPIWAAAD